MYHVWKHLHSFILISNNLIIKSGRLLQSCGATAALTACSSRLFLCVARVFLLTLAAPPFAVAPTRCPGINHVLFDFIPSGAGALEVVVGLMDSGGPDRWQPAQPQRLLWVCVHPEVPNFQPGSHSLALVRGRGGGEGASGGWQGRSVGSSPVHGALSFRITTTDFLLVVSHITHLTLHCFFLISTFFPALFFPYFCTTDIYIFLC